MTTQTKMVTAEELLEMPGGGKRRELVRGEMREMELAGATHGAVALNIGASVFRRVEEDGLGRTYAAGTGFQLAEDPDTVRAPDVAFVNQARLDSVGVVQGYWPGAPDFVVEVVSPEDTSCRVMDQTLSWLEAGSRMVLVIDAEIKTVEVYRSREDIRVLTAEADDVVDGADVVPGWRLSIAEIFA